MSTDRADAMLAQTKRAVLNRLRAGQKVRLVCFEFGVSFADIEAIKEWAERIELAKQENAEIDEKKAAFIPTLEEIEAARDEIQAGWSKRERRRRDVRAGGRVEIDFIRVGAQRHAKHGGDR